MGHDTESTLDGTNNAGSFQSVRESQQSDESEDLPDWEIVLEARTAGLPHDAREWFKVNNVKNAPHTLGPEDLDHIESFNFFVQNKPSINTYQAIQDAYVHKRTHRPLASLKVIRQCALALSALKPVEYHCFKKSCVCYTGYLSNLQQCPHCATPRLDPSGNPYSTYWHIPLIPQLLALFCNPATAKLLKYRTNYTRNDLNINDIFDSNYYNKLHEMFVNIEGQEQAYQFFEDLRELLLGLLVDGMCLFNKRKHSCWPLILVIYNFPPEIRTRLENIICVGVVPGPHSPKDLNSYLQPLVDEFILLAKGVEAVDILREETFTLRAYLVPIFGDLPALAKLLEFISHNGCHPCRFCMIASVISQTEAGTHLYCPLHRPNNESYDPLDLPMHTHEDSIRQGCEVLSAPTEHAASRLATQYSVKGVSLLARLPSVRVPNSFPVKTMHVIWINLIPQLIDLWTGKFHGIGTRKENYNITVALWTTIGDICKESGKTIPASFGCRVPHLDKQSHFTAESWCLWATLLAPHVLQRRFVNAKYYTHFVQLIKLIKKCLSVHIPWAELPHIQQGLVTWIQEYEE
ncbi:hypothetical protein FRC10_008502 [Ceratobasidium sp. 414]|nr:hypothetical protein FRC10_008502 [Ceratobasidium sp. 414]